MFAMFHLGRRDVLPIGDLGVRNGMKELYGLKVSPLSLTPKASVIFGHLPFDSQRCFV